jgi:hypothetical protein
LDQPSADTVQGALSAAFEAAEKTEVAQTEVTQADKETPAKSDRARDEHGKFAKAEQSPTAEDAKAEKAEAEPAAKDAAQDQEAEQEAQTTEVIEPPRSWSAEEKAEFTKLPPEIQRTLSRREADRDRLLTQKANELAREKRRFDELDRVLEPHRQEMHLAGMSEAQGIARLIAAHESLKRNPAQAIAWLAKEYGADLNSLNKPDTTDPTVRQLQQQVQQLTAQLQGHSQAQTQEREMTVLQEIERFATEAKDGKPLRPHWEAVAGDMPALIQIVRGQNPHLSTREVMQEAYDRAVWANPEIRESLRKSEAEQAQAKQRAEQAAAAERARKAAVSVSGAPGGSSAKAPETVRGALEQAWPG